MLATKGDYGKLAVCVTPSFSTALKRKAWPTGGAFLHCSGSLQEQHLQAAADSLWPEQGAELYGVPLVEAPSGSA